VQEIFLFPKTKMEENKSRSAQSPIQSPAQSAVGVKGKAIPLQALTGPEGFMSLKLPDFKTLGT
jgi:hypothetical protein